MHVCTLDTSANIQNARREKTNETHAESANPRNAAYTHAYAHKPWRSSCTQYECAERGTHESLANVESEHSVKVFAS